MLKRLGLRNFKNFQDAALTMGPFTLLVGANASGKSNLREALRFLHGVGRGYKLAEILGGKWTQWDGLRGGAAEAAHRKEGHFALQLEWEMKSVHDPWVDEATLVYDIEVALSPSMLPTIARESLLFPADAPTEPSEAKLVAYRAAATAGPAPASAQLEVHVARSPDAWRTLSLSADQPALTQLHVREGSDVEYVETTVLDTLHTLQEMRFIDLLPEAMRGPSVPGQRVLADRGDNLSSVLQTLCADAATKEDIIGWLRLLTPMDVADLRFEADVRGHVILMIVERDGHAYSAYSASDGTLRFLGVLAALFSPEPSLFFFEELENGLHPTRIKLLVELFRSRTREGKVQVVATTHSPTVLSLLYDDELQHASLVYRLEGASAARITRVLDIPDAARVLASHDRGELLASGWFEGMVEFAAAPPGAAA